MCNHIAAPYSLNIYRVWNPTITPHSLSIEQGVKSYSSTPFTQYTAGCGILQQHPIHSIYSRVWKPRAVHSIYSRVWNPTAAPHSLNIQQGVETNSSTPFTQYTAGCGILWQYPIHSIYSRVWNHTPIHSIFNRVWNPTPIHSI